MVTCPQVMFALRPSARQSLFPRQLPTCRDSTACRSLAPSTPRP
uniref:Uncharacterized protein n=1 Tax=Anguilla anguilla TaxID=7936 RepID=A0A0E9VX72_ANGAN